MITPSIRGGSRISVRDLAPSVDLSTLVGLLVKCLPPTGPELEGLPLASLDGRKLRLNTYGVLRRLLVMPEFKPAFSPGEEKGFLRDATTPPFGTTAKMGGRLVQGSDAAASKGIEALREAVSTELDSALKDFDVRELSMPSLQSTLERMTATIGRARSLEVCGEASMVPVRFSEPERPAKERSEDIGRVLSGIEMVDGKDWLELLLAGIRRRLENDDYDSDDIDEIVAAIRTQNGHPESQVHRFLEFLEDEAMARVRMQVCMRLMSAVADQSRKAGFKSYVRRVRECFELFADFEGEALTFDVSKAYGLANNVHFEEELRKALFYGCLPVWSEASAQLFERRVNPENNTPTLREVSYRFRVNGTNPSTGKSSFESRLDRLHARLLDDPKNAGIVKRHIAELVFLTLVVPSSMDDERPTSVKDDARAIAKGLQEDPVGMLGKLHERLFNLRGVMDALSAELIYVLKEKSRAIVTATNRSASKALICVHRNIVDWAVIKGMDSAQQEFLVKSPSGSDNIAWFGNLRVSESLWPGSLVSIHVETHLQERSLTPEGESSRLPMRKCLDAPALPVRLIPFHKDDSDGEWRADVPNSGVLDAGRGVDVEYSLRLLRLKRKTNGEKETAEQLRSALMTAFTVLSYVALWEITRRVKAATPRVAMTMVRLQQTGKAASREVDASDPNTAIYCVSQALEKALSRELPVKLQGLTTDAREGALDYRNSGAVAALLGGQPVRFRQEGSLDKVALLSYVTRPCDAHPSFPNSDGYLFISRTYVADAQSGEMTLRVDRMLSRLVDNRADFQEPHLILEEISRLRSAGYRHVLLLSHHFGNRHIGRAAERHSPHGSLKFLDEAASRFPDMHLYPLRRDVFPATRLRKRDSTESGFEVARYEAHQKMYLDHASEVLRSLLPIYTFATLHVVGDTKKPQSGFCTYFYDAEHRLSDFGLKEVTRANILGTGSAQSVRTTLVSVLRAVHFMESEKASNKNNLLPVLDPFDWATPTTTAGAGEAEAVTRRNGGTILLSLPAVLAHVTKVLHKGGSTRE